jgi:hypothetical protein
MKVPPKRGLGRLPDFIIIGTQKGGTTGLHHYLSRHPEVAVSRIKELNFFIEEGVLPPDPSGRPRGAWNKGVEWYREWFDPGKLVCGEASPQYASHPHAEVVAARMAAVVPQVRLIYLVRHPLERMRSHYLMMSKRPGVNPGTFEAFVRSSEALGTSRYGTQLQAYLKHFPREHILVVESERLRRQRRAALAEVFGFLGVDPAFWCDWYQREVFVGSRRPHVSPWGVRLRDSWVMRGVRRALPDGLAFHGENLLLAPFAVPPPTTELSAAFYGEILAELRGEVELLRRLTGQPLLSLELSGPGSKGAEVWQLR